MDEGYIKIFRFFSRFFGSFGLLAIIWSLPTILVDAAVNVSRNEMILILGLCLFYAILRGLIEAYMDKQKADSENEDLHIR